MLGLSAKDDLATKLRQVVEQTVREVSERARMNADVSLNDSSISSNHDSKAI
jgi:hypothetical protein